MPRPLDQRVPTTAPHSTADEDVVVAVVVSAVVVIKAVTRTTHREVTRTTHKVDTTTTVLVLVVVDTMPPLLAAMPSKLPSNILLTCSFVSL